MTPAELAALDGHTPGPWALHLVDDTTIIDASGRFIGSVIGGDDDLAEHDYNNPDDWPILDANARLIAAAPDLLAEVKRLRAALEVIADWPEIWNLSDEAENARDIRAAASNALEGK